MALRGVARSAMLFLFRLPAAAVLAGQCDFCEALTWQAAKLVLHTDKWYTHSTDDFFVRTANECL